MFFEGRGDAPLFFYIFLPKIFMINVVYVMQKLYLYSVENDELN